MPQIVTTAIVKSDWLGIGVTTPDTTQDAAIGRLIDAVAEEIKGICNQPIVQESVTLTIMGASGNKFPLYYTVPVSLTSVKYKQEMDDAAWTTVTGSVVFPLNGVNYLYNENGFPESFYQVIADIGYTTVPADIQVCAAEMVKELWYELFNAQEARFGVSAISEGFGTTGTITRTLQRMRPLVEMKLQRYRIFTT